MTIQTKTSKDKKVTWSDYDSPDQQTLADIQRKYNFDSIDVADCDVITQRPKIVKRQHYLFLILHVPIFDREERRTSTAELDIFVTRDQILTLHPKHILKLKYLFDEMDLDKIASGKHNPSGKLLYLILKSLFDDLFNKLDHISEHIDEIEEGIFERKNVIQEILLIKRDIINFRRIIRPQRTVLDPLTKNVADDYFNDNLSTYFKTIVGIVIRLWNVLESQKEFIDTLENTNESMLSQKLNQTMTLLTMGSFVLLPLSIIAGLAGDAVLLTNNSWTIFTITLVIIMISGAIIYVKKNKIF